MKSSFNVKGERKACAFCKYWYDPTNSAISPVNPLSGMWEYDPAAKSYCTIHQGPAIALANNRCPKYECKIPTK